MSRRARSGSTSGPRCPRRRTRRGPALARRPAAARARRRRRRRSRARRVDRALQQRVEVEAPSAAGRARPPPLALLGAGELRDVLDEALEADGLALRRRGRGRRGRRAAAPRRRRGGRGSGGRTGARSASEALRGLADAVELLRVGHLELVARLRRAAERGVAAHQAQQLGRVDDRLGPAVHVHQPTPGHPLGAGEHRLALAQRLLARRRSVTSTTHHAHQAPAVELIG